MQLRVDSYKGQPLNPLESLPQTFKQSFVPKWLFVQKALPLLEELIHSSTEEIETFNPLSWLWNQLTRYYPSMELFYRALTKRQAELAEIKENFRPFIGEKSLFDPVYADLLSLASAFFENGTYQIDPDRLTPTSNQGVSGSYFLLDETGHPRFVIKPLDEDAGCINNPQGFATLLDRSPLRENMPLYHSSMREALAYQIALSIGVDSIAPKTVLAILQSDQFYDLSQCVPTEEMDRYLELCGAACREKICSIQEVVPNAITLFEAQQALQAAGLSDEEIAARFDQSDFEDMNILLWSTYDTDGHMGNILVYPKGYDALGNEILGLKKIDNGLAFPDKNEQLRNNLVYLPNGSLPLSDSAKCKIANLNVDQMADLYRSYGLESAIPALQIRIPLLQEYAQKPGITIKELNAYMAKIGNSYS
ncbi:MAG: hypothetical protein V4487_00745 [Chlamydiota bacterium]